MLKKLFGKPSKKHSKKLNQPHDTASDSFASSVSGKCLPAGFADELLNLEMEMEQDSVDLTNVKKLLELYANAVEYYESIRSDKYFIFKNKTQALLLKPNVSSAMIREQMILSGKSLTPISSGSKTFEFGEEKIENLKANLGLQLQLKEHQLKVQYINSQPSQENAKILLTQHEQEQYETKNIINGQIKGQTDEVLKRLEQRRKSRLERSLNLEKLSVSVDEGYDKMNRNNHEEFNGDQNKMLELSDLFNQINLKNSRNTSPKDVGKHHFETHKCSDQSSSTKESTTAVSADNDDDQKNRKINKDNIEFARELCITNEINQGTKQNNNNIFFNNTSNETTNQEPNWFTPKKQNISKQPSDSKEISFFSKVVLSSNSNSKNQQFNDSPVLVKRNSYGKGELKQVNFNWMTASTNSFHAPFNFK